MIQIGFLTILIFTIVIFFASFYRLTGFPCLFFAYCSDSSKVTMNPADALCCKSFRVCPRCRKSNFMLKLFGFFGILISTLIFIFHGKYDCLLQGYFVVPLHGRILQQSNIPIVIFNASFHRQAGFPYARTVTIYIPFTSILSCPFFTGGNG